MPAAEREIAGPADLAGVIRLSNGQGCPFKDAGPDVRGAAFKLVDEKQQVFDTLLTNHQTFAEDVPMDLYTLFESFIMNSKPRIVGVEVRSTVHQLPRPN